MFSRTGVVIVELIFASDIEKSYLGYFFNIATLVLVVVFFSKIKFIYEKHLLSKVKINIYIIVFSLFLVVATSINNKINRNSFVELITKNDFFIEEGVIANLVYDKKASTDESFTVNGVYFSYNDYGTDRFFFANRKRNTTTIKNGAIVRVHYLVIDGENYIFKFELKKEISNAK